MTATRRLSIPSLNGLRCMSIALVFLNHAGYGSTFKGTVGVTVFFFLSGYLITTLLRVEWEDTGRVSLRNFYVRRVLRILPPLYLLIVVATILGATRALIGVPSLDGVISEIFNFSNYYVVFHHGAGGLPPGTSQTWSLGVEEHFYLLFPILYLSLVRWAPRAVGPVLVGLIILVTLWRVELVYDLHRGFLRLDQSTDTRFDSLLYGCLLALYRNPALGESRLNERLLKRLLFPLGVVLFVFTLRWNGPSARAFEPAADALALLPIFIGAIRYPDWGICRALNWRWVSHLGVLSYAAYLVHRVLIFSWKQAVPALSKGEIAIVAAACTVVVAQLVHVGIERPAHRLRRRLESVATPSDDAPAAAAAGP